MARMRQNLPWYAAHPPRGPVPINPAIADLTGLLWAYGPHNSLRPRDAVSGSVSDGFNLSTLTHRNGYVALDMSATNAFVNWPAGDGSRITREMVANKYRRVHWFGVQLGAMTGTPEYFGLSRANAQTDYILSIFDGGTDTLGWQYAYSPTLTITRSANLSRSAHYNKPISLFASVVTVDLASPSSGALVEIDKGAYVTGAGSNPAVNFTLAASTTERVIIGPDIAEQGGGARAVNNICFGAAIYGRAIWSDALEREIGRKPYALWLPYERRSFVDFGFVSTAPEIAVTGNGNAITDGDATPSATDHTDFGTITEGGATVSRTFTVENTGGATLNISSVTVPTGFTKTTDLPSTIAAAGTAPLIVRLDNTPVGVKSGDITINSDDADEAAFNFAITGTVSAPPPPPPPSGIPFSPTTNITFTPSGLLIR